MSPTLQAVPGLRPCEPGCARTGDRRPRRYRLLRALASLLTALAGCLPGCVNADDDDDDGDDGGSTPTAAVLYISHNGGSNRGDVDRFDEQLVASGGTFSGSTNEGVTLDVSGNLYGAVDGLAVTASSGSDGKGGGITDGAIDVIGGFAVRLGDTFDPSLDRRIGGPGSANALLQNPKGVEIAHLEGLVFAADAGAGDIKVFGTAAGGDVPPLAVTPTSAPPWDLAYDAILDCLYVSLTNGQIEIFEDYTSDLGAAGDRIIIPSDGVTQVSTNLHGIDYNFGIDSLVVTDVGVPGIGADGSIFVFSSVSTLSGLNSPDRTITGGTPLLGDPVDCFLVDDALFVAEKFNDAVLRFDDVFFGTIDVPGSMTFSNDLESICGMDPTDAPDPDVSDVDAGRLILSVATTSNPGVQSPPDPAFGEFARLLPSLQNTLDTFPVGVHLENVTFDLTGDAFLTFDDGMDQNGGIFVGNRLARARPGQPAPTPSRDRVISGPATQLTAPKGIESVRSLGLLLVADNDSTSPAIRAFGPQANGNVPPVFSTDLSAVGRPWDLDYDPVGDRLFVALTNGSVAVFDAYGLSLGAAGPDRMITPGDGVGPTSVNLHGVVYDQANDTLILSDVGSAADPTDGRVFVVQNAAGADGVIPVSVEIGGPSTMLGNPVDVAFDGEDLYVAEKSNDVVLRFDGVLGSLGGDVAPSESLARTKPESVALVPLYLSRTPGF